MLGSGSDPLVLLRYGGQNRQRAHFLDFTQSGLGPRLRFLRIRQAAFRSIPDVPTEVVEVQQHRIDRRYVLQNTVPNPRSAVGQGDGFIGLLEVQLDRLIPQKMTKADMVLLRRKGQDARFLLVLEQGNLHLVEVVRGSRS